MNSLHIPAIHQKDLLTGTHVRTGHLLSREQAADLEKYGGVKPEYIAARRDGVLGEVIAELSGARGYPFLVAHQDEDGMKDGSIGVYFACELFRPF